MDIKILDSHLREFLDTKAKPAEIAKYLSLSGPSVERVHKLANDYLYDIEITTNRVDSASVVGIAREAAAILPQFGVPAKLKTPKRKNLKLGIDKVLPLTLKSDPRLVKRLTGIVISDIKNWDSPKYIKDRLLAAGIRSLNAVVDITNYVMITIGHPSHAFDYDKIKDHKIIVRESKKGEKIVSLDSKTHTLPGNDIVFEDVDGKIIDLPGIIGTKNSVVSENTENILFFFDNNDAVRIRRTSMSLGIRTMAATLNEKHVDAELIPLALAFGVSLFEKICKAKVTSSIYDVYHKPYKAHEVTTNKIKIEKTLGVTLEKNKITSILKSLDFDPKWQGDTVVVKVPSFRAHDIDIEEDIAEEVARLYGYHNLPSQLMAGELPEPVLNSPFRFEDNLRQTLKNLGGIEILTYSLVTKEMAGENALKLTNPLGSDTEYLRMSLMPSLIEAARNNKGVEGPFHLFEIANVYSARKNALPEEKMTLGGVFINTDYRHAKGIVEALFESLNIKEEIKIKASGNMFLYEFEVTRLSLNRKPKAYIPIPKYPPQIEDMTIEIPEGKLVGEVVKSIKDASKLVQSVELTDIYERKFTFRISYQDPKKTLSDKEVEEVRKKIEKAILNL